VLLINVLLARQRPGRWQIGALVLSYLGVLLAFGHDLQREGGRSSSAACWCWAVRSATRCTCSAVGRWSRASVRCG
jgi:drug/metabolite transporter (DMT)-like permease